MFGAQGTDALSLPVQLLGTRDTEQLS